MTLLATLSLTSALVVMMATPGPGVMATVARALNCGFRPTLMMIAGMVLGDLIFLLFAIFGLAVVAELLGDLFVLIKLAGGGYLIWLGWKIWRNSDQPLQPAASQSSRSGHFLSGLLITLANPKVIIFYCSLLPNFVDLHLLQTGEILLLAAVITLCLASVMISYALLASQTRQLLRKPATNRAVQKTAGGIMITAGALVASRS